MRLPWNKHKSVQLDMFEDGPRAAAPRQSIERPQRVDAPKPEAESISTASGKPGGPDGIPLLVPVSLLHEHTHYPRTEFPEDSLAEDIQQCGVPQPLVVHPSDAMADIASTSAPSGCEPPIAPGFKRGWS